MISKTLLRHSLAALVLAIAGAAQSSAHVDWSITIGGPPAPPLPPPPPGPPLPPPPPGPIMGPGPVITVGPSYMPPRWMHRWHRPRYIHPRHYHPGPAPRPMGPPRRPGR